MEKRKCPICRGIGFADGEICPCITGKKTGKMPDLPEGLRDIFRDIFEGSHAESNEK